MWEGEGITGNLEIICIIERNHCYLGIDSCDHVGCGPSVFRFLIVQKKLLKIISPQTVLDDLEEGRKKYKRRKVEKEKPIGKNKKICMKDLGLLCFLNKKQRGGRINHLLIHKYVYFLSVR